MTQTLFLLVFGTIVVCCVYLIKRDKAPPRITQQPEDLELKLGEKELIQVPVEGSRPFTFQWFRDGQLLDIFTDSFLEIEGDSSSHQCTYHLIVRNACGEVRSRGFRVSILTLPFFEREPEHISVMAGEGGVLSAEVSSPVSLNYQWFRNGVPIPCENNATLLLPALTEEDNGAEYKLQVSNKVGEVFSQPVKVTVEVNRLIFGDPTSPAIELSRWQGLPVRTRDLSVTPLFKSRMAMMIQPAINLSQQGHQVTQQSFKIIFKPSALEGLRDGTFHLMEGTKGQYVTAVNSANGRIVGNGQLVASNATRVAAIAAASFQVLAVITAQKFLGDIDKKLASLSKGVKEIQDWLEEESWATLQSDHDYLTSIAETIQSQKLSHAEVTTFLTCIEMVDHNASRIALMSSRKLERLSADIPNIEKSWTSSGVKEDVDLLQNKMEEWGHYAHCFMGALRLKGAAAQLRCSLPVHSNPSEYRLKSLEAALKQMQVAHAEFSKAVGYQAEKLDSCFSKEESLVLKGELMKQINEYGRQICDHRDDMETTVRTLRDGLQEMRSLEEKGITMLVNLAANGDVASIKQIEENV